MPLNKDSRLPSPVPEALVLSDRLLQMMQDESSATGGWLSFHRYMELALYAPRLGYYAAGSHKLGAAGDFVTAPEISPLFGHCMARQCAQVLDALGSGEVLEFGAGTGRLAAHVLETLAGMDALPDRYLILETSPDLRERQQAALSLLPQALSSRVHWLDGLPEPGSFRGVMLANEVLDAMPVELFVWGRDGVMRRGVQVSSAALAWADRPADAWLVRQVRALHQAAGANWGEGYVSELNPGLAPWLAAVSEAMAAGVLLLVDYGYPRREYYSAERCRGTLIAHYRHRMLEHPLLWPGLMDITANVDFSAVAEAGAAAGLSLLGYTSQAWFLFGTDLEAAFQARCSEDLKSQLALASQVRTLTLPGEMGERFQVMALGRGVETPLMGFARQDLSHRL
ncbi:class I SAM-dependent methyltransferase [Ectothiorhodospira lacustris]|uniref:class I SAM-dependent methyltransferase n=1 Tax=Ectothiorhodospira lacustris TaxID=2899127 RepID=UPI001EE9151E|nr:SAM-dependent methyltransferase [Ectothiorhodospira lacustris]MCG5510586.1 SAM-dependent methyltransferase [Ectothiorhodospira lacustris]MCG5521278.1 SAM-dependent methyltransferase [Ectothiorhodospira lacustris]